MTWKKAIALLLVIVLLGAGAFYLYQVEHNDKQNMKDLYTEVEPLQKQREALVSERDSLELDYALQMRDYGTIQLLFEELNDQIFTEVYPLMRDRGIVGVLGVNTKEYPGLMKKMPRDQFNRLLMDGWGSCLIFEKNQIFTRWFTNLSNLMNRDGLTMPTAIFFPEGTYDEALNEDLISCGITTVILPAADGRSQTVTSLDGELWFTGAMPWNYTGVNTDTELLARTNGANLTFTISFNNLWDAYEKEPFTRVLDNWVSMLYVDDPLEELTKPAATPNPLDPTATVTPQDQLLMPLLKTSNYETARAAHLEAETNNDELLNELETRRHELDLQIESLDEQIREVYNKWEKTGKIGQ